MFGNTLCIIIIPILPDQISNKANFLKENKYICSNIKSNPREEQFGLCTYPGWVCWLDWTTENVVNENADKNTWV